MAADAASWRENGGRERQIAYVAANRDRVNGYSRKYYAENREKHRALLRRRRAILRGLPAERINPREIFERDEWTCGICREPVDSELVYPHPHSASLDHVVPISRQGGHLKENVQLAHLRCNIAKSAKLMEELDVAAA